MDVAEQIVSEYLKMNGFTFVTNIKYENNSPEIFHNLWRIW